MTLECLATDYDGTLAHDGVVNDATIAALERARTAGLRLVMVTGRELRDLFSVFSHSTLFDSIVAENGAVLYDPGTDTVDVLAPPPPKAFLEKLATKNVPISVGRSIVATLEPYEHDVLSAIRDLGIEWHIIFNKGSVMALPAAVTKATGLAAALKPLGITAERTVGVGDAENDQAFMRSCGVAAAVANALPSVKDLAQIVTTGARGDGVIELIDLLINGDLDRLMNRSRTEV